ncbi:MAG TPA: hypothetical protein VMY40_14875 [Anaerolineae bacterium]|nr:hypothetical protein [Anaerolineae bacterium]
MSAYDDLMGSVGDVDIGDVDIGDPAEMTEKLAAALYADRPFTREDEVDLGFYDGVAIAPGGTRQIAIQSDNPFKPLALCVPSWQAPGLQIQNIKISAVNLIEGGPVPADMFTEVSNIARVNYPTIQTSGRIVIDLVNRSAAAITPSIGIKGKRIRGA